jgi:hypothetical protein
MNGTVGEQRRAAGRVDADRSSSIVKAPVLTAAFINMSIAVLVAQATTDLGPTVPMRLPVPDVLGRPQLVLS